LTLLKRTIFLLLLLLLVQGQLSQLSQGQLSQGQLSQLSQGQPSPRVRLFFSLFPYAVFVSTNSTKLGSHLFVVGEFVPHLPGYIL